MPGHSPPPDAQEPPRVIVRSPLVGLSVLVAGLVVSGWIAWQQAEQVTDLTQDYFAARAVLAGGNVYEPVGERELAEHGLSLDGHLDATVRNFHPPFDSLIAIPVACLPHRTASLVWAGLTVAVYLALLVLLGRGCGMAPPEYVGPLVCGLALFWPPFVQHLQDGQLSLLIAAFVSAAWWLSRSGRDTPAGALIGIAAAVKLFPLLFLVHFLLRRRWRAFVTGLLSFALAGVASGFAAGWDVLYQYVTQVAPQNSAEYADNPYNVSLPGLLQRLFAGRGAAPAAFPGFVPVIDLGSGVMWVKLAAVLAVYGPVAARDARMATSTRAADDLGFAQTAVTMLLLSPLTWQHALVITLLPLAVLWQHADRAGVIVTTVLLSFPVVATARTVVQHFYPGPAPALWSLVPAIPTLGLVGLWWRLGRLCGRERSPAAQLVGDAASA